MKKLFTLFLFFSLLCGCAQLPTAPEAPPPAATDAAVPEEGLLSVHFIDVGQADCALLECDGQYLLIDGGNKEDGQLVVSYLLQQGVEELDAVVCTHAHEDHVGGLPAVLAVFPTAAVYAPTSTYSSNIFDDFLHYTHQQGLEITIPAPGDSLTLGGAELTVMGPVKSYAETNDTSIVLMAQYSKTRFLFTGDMETPAESDMLDHWEGFSWKVDVLKVGHHGSSTSSGYRFLYETDPGYAVISCGKDNSYGHPHEEVVSRFSDAGVPMLRTDELGTIVAQADGTEVTFFWENQNAQPGDVEQAGEETLYIGNKNSLKLHVPDCSSLPKEENRVTFSSYDDALAAGYTPCGSCME